MKAGHHISIGDGHGSAGAFDRRLLREAQKDEAGTNPLTQAVCDALREVIGTYGIAVISADQPETIVGARRGSPLIIGIGDGENFLASDANAIVAHTQQGGLPERLRRGDVTRDRFDVQNLGTDTANVQISKLEFSAEDAERGEYRAFHAQGNF